MKWFFASLFILLGAFLFFVTIDDMGYLGYMIKILIGVGCFYIAGYIVNGKKKKN